MQISSVRHAWPEAAGFSLDRPLGHAEYTFLHFYNSVEIHLNGRMVRTRPHACILFAPGTPQKFCSAAPLIHDWFHFSTAKPLPMICCDTLYYPADTAFVTAIVRELETEMSAEKTDYALLLSLKVQELFIKVARGASGESPAPIKGNTAKQLKSLRQQILTHLSENWTVERMADLVHLSPSRFHSVYRSFYGRSPTEDLICARIEAAKTALLHSDESLSDIAERLGYTNVTHFSRQFSARVGTPPGAYRNRRQ